MNFEQNFSPLDTESSEYQSINIVPLIEPISADPEQEEPKKTLAKIEQPVKIREIKPLPKVQAPKVDMAKVPKVERGPSFTFPAEEVDTLYNSFSDSSNYINGIISQKLKEFDSGGEQTKGAADSVRGYMSLINQANNPNDLAKRTDLVYNMMNEISDIQTNNATRDSFINSQYTPAFYSKSKALADEYNASDLKSVLTPRQYTGLKSLSYGKQGEYQDYLNTITDPKAKEVDKQLALLNLDKIGAAIDTNASAKLISDIKAGKADKNNLVFGRDLYLQSRYDLLNADEKIRDVEFNNPYNLSVAKNIVSRAVERGLLISESADMLSVSSDLSGVDVNRLIEIQRLQQDARSSKAFEEFYNNPSLETFSKNPIGILSELALESLVAMYTHGATRMGAGALEGAAIGTVIPGLGNVAGATSGVIAGIGLTSINLNMVSTILDGIAEAGYNTTSAEDLRKAFQDEKLMSKLRAEGWKSGTPLAIFDMLSVGLAGKIISKPARTIAGKIFAGTAELGAQAGFGMAGEAGKQIVTSGKINKPVDVFMEGLGEIGPGVPEIAFGAITEKAKNNQAQAKRDLAIVIDGIGLQKANDQIDVLIGSGQISQEQGQQLKDETKKAFEQMQKMPSMLSNEARGQIMELVDKRDALMSGSENLDEVFKKQATKEAEAINAQILDIANKDISSQQKQKEDAIKESRGTQQEGVPEGGISQYQGAQAIQAQKTTEADTRNSVISSTEEIRPQFQKAFREDVINGFYSPITIRVNEFKQSNASAKKWMDIVGVKSDEAIFSGLTEWLNSKKPDEQVSKDDVLNFMSQNRIKIKEIVRGGDYVVRNIKTGQDVAYFKNADDAYAFAADEERGKYEVDEPEVEVSYEQYQIPGGDNYKEILITLPTKIVRPDMDFTIKSRAEYYNDRNNFSAQDNGYGYLVESNRGARMYLDKSDYNLKSPEDAIEAYIEREKEYIDNETWDFYDKDGVYFNTVTAPNKGSAKAKYIRDNSAPATKGFVSSHFYEQNILSHLRMNIRTDVNGKKVLFLEEIQSDWGQKGKKEGFGLSEDAKKYFELKKKEDYLESKYKDKYGEDWYDKISKEESDEYYDNRRDMMDLSSSQYETRIPEGPYVTNTNAWVKLGLKVALKEALKQNVDAIAWTTGNQQNDRYDLARVIEKIDAYPASYTERGEKGDITSFNIVTKYNSGTSREEIYTVDELPNILGKDLADKIITNKGGKYSGLDLKVGGKGMKAFYGDAENVGIVGNVAKSLIKELTGEAGNLISIDVNTGELQPGIEFNRDIKNSVASGMPQFQIYLPKEKNIIDDSEALITEQINSIDGASVEFKVDESISQTVKSDIASLMDREGLAKKPNVIAISDFYGVPVMLTISDTLRTGDIVNPLTGNTITNLNGGLGFNFSEGNTESAWAYTDYTAASRTLSAAKKVYEKNPQLYPDGIVPVAIVRMGDDAIKSNEAILRVLLDNIRELPKKNLDASYRALLVDIKNELDKIEAKKKSFDAQGKKFKGSDSNNLKGYREIYNNYLKKNKSIVDVVENMKELNITTRPLLVNRITTGEAGKSVSRYNVGKNTKEPALELIRGLNKEEVKRIHLGYISDLLYEPTIKKVPQRHIIGFVGIDIRENEPIKSNHPNYPFALKGKGLGIVENTAHLASVMPQAYGNAVKKITDSVLKNETITPSESVSRAIGQGLTNVVFRGKTLVERETELSKLIGFMNTSFPNVTFFTDEASFNDIIQSESVKKYVKDGEIIYGLTTDGKIYLNPSIATANTAIHEMGHIWVDYIQNKNNKLFQKGVSLIDGTVELEEAIQQLGDNILARKEALAMLIGNRGETIVNASQRSKFKEWLIGLWQYLQQQFPSLRALKPNQVETLTLEQFIGGALKDILSGEVITEKEQEYVNIGAAAQKMSDIVPFEPQLPEGPQGPTPPGEVGPVKEPSGELKKTEYWTDSFMRRKMEGVVGEPMIETSTGKFVGLTNMRGQIMEINRKLKETKSSISERLKKIYNYTKLVSTDNQQLIFALLDYAGRSGQLVQAYLRTRNSASDTSNILVDVVTKDIFGGLSKTKMYTFGDNKISEYVLFNHMIGYQRVISIQQQMDETYEQMKAEWKKIKPQFDAVQEAKIRLDKAKSILSTDEFKSLSEIEKAVIRDRVNTIEKELGSLNAKFARDSREYNKNKQRLIDNNMIDESGVYVGETLSKEFAQGDITATQAYKNLQEIRELIGEEEFSKLMTRSQAYSQLFNRMLKARMEAGIVSQDTYNYLSKFFYAPTRYISDVLSNPILSMAVPTSSYKAQKLKIKNLSGGSERLNVSDYEGLMKAVIYASEYSISENETASRLYIEVENNEELYAKIGVRLGVKYIPIEEKADTKNTDIIDDNLNRITEGKKPSSFRVLPSGQKQLPYNGIQKVNKNILSLDKVSIEDLPSVQEGGKYKTGDVYIDDFGEGYLDAEVVVDENGKRFLAVDLPANQATEGYINIYVNGKENRLIVPKGIAEAWYNENITKGVIPQIASFLGKWTGVNALRLLATGASPTFGIFQVLKDVPSAYAATIGERKYRPLILDFPSFFTNSIKPVFKDILTNSKDYQEARAYGATTNFYNGGSVSFERGLQGVVKKSLEEKLSESRIPILGPALKWYISISKKIAETMEQTTKIALYKDIRNKKIKEYKDKNGVEPTGLDLEDIRVEAAAAARSVADFHRRGVLGGPANMVFGYLNAQIQVQDAVLKSSVNNKAKTIAYTMEFGSYVTIAILYSLGAFDEDEEKKIKKRKAYDRLSDYEKDNYIPLYYIESEDKFFKLPIAEFLSPVVTIIRRSLYRTVVEKNYKASSSEYRDDILESAKSVLSEYPELQILKPEEKILSRNPTYSAMSKLFANWDPYRQERVVDEDYERKTPDYLEGILNQKSPSSKILQQIGKSAKDYVPLIFPEGISPKKIDAAMKSWPFETNPFTGGLEYLINTRAMDKKGFEEKYGKDALSQILKVSGVSQRFFTRATNISNGIVNIPIKEVKDRTEFRIKLEMDIVPKFDSLLNDMSRIDAYKKITREFVSNHIKNKDNTQNLSPEQAEIARNWFTTRFRDIVKAGVDDPIVNQIIKMETGDAKLDAIDKTLNNIQLTDSAKLKFLKDLYDAGVMNSENIRERINQRGNRNMITKNGERVENPYFEPGIGYIRDNMIKIAKEKRAKQ